MATIPLDEIAPGATVRFTVIDGVQYLSIRDFIMHVGNTSNDYAGDPRKPNEVRDFFPNLKRGSRFFPEPQTRFEIFSRTSKTDQIHIISQGKRGGT
jgi:hypothetical protein